MVNTNPLDNSDVRKIVQQKGCFKVIEYLQDVSVQRDNAQNEYFASKMNVHKRQVVAELAGGGIVVQAGAMQLMADNVNAAADIKGAGGRFSPQG